MATRQYIGARYVPKFFENSSTNDSTWSANTIYEPLTLVTYNLNTYCSKKAVPASVGNPSQNGTYWVAISFTSEQVNELQEQISAIADNIDDIEDNIDDIESDVSNIDGRFDNGVLDVLHGGTAATSADVARQNLGCMTFIHVTESGDAGRIPIQSNGKKLKYTFSANFKGLLIVTGSSDAKQGLYILNGTSGAVTVTAINAVSSLSITTSGNVLYIYDTSSGSSFGDFVSSYARGAVTVELVDI